MTMNISRIWKFNIVSECPAPCRLLCPFLSGTQHELKLSTPKRYAGNVQPLKVIKSLWTLESLVILEGFIMFHPPYENRADHRRNNDGDQIFADQSWVHSFGGVEPHYSPASPALACAATPEVIRRKHKATEWHAGAPCAAMRYLQQQAVIRNVRSCLSHKPS